MSSYDFNDPVIRKALEERAVSFIQQVRSTLLKNPKYKILKGRFLDRIWQERVHAKELFCLYMKEEEIDKLTFKELDNKICDIYRTLHRFDSVELDGSLNIIKTGKIPHQNSSDAKKFFKELSNSEYYVFFFGQEAVDIFIRGENMQELNLFYCKEDVQRYNEKWDITQLDKVLEVYQNQYLTRQHEYLYFFADNTLLYRIDPNLFGKNILKNKPEKLMRDHLKTFLNDRTQHTFLIETELSASKRELDIYTEVNGEFYFIEIKWLGLSIDDSGSKIGRPYTDSRAREGVTQTLVYIEELVEVMNVNVKCGFLVIFDARENKNDIDYQGYRFLTENLKKYIPLFELLPDIKIDNRHPA